MTLADKPESAANDTDSTACRRFRVTGRVQGVFFRASTQATARGLGLTGYAINRPDGSVEVLACGRLRDLDALEEYLQHGPRHALVAGVEREDRAFEERASFTTG